MPFRVRITVVALVVLASLVAVGPLVWPIAPLAGTRPAREVAGAGATFVDAPGISLHVVEWGERRPSDEPWTFLGLHGFGSSSASFAALADALTDVAPFVAYDRPGFGLGERPVPPFGVNPYDPDAEVGQVLAVLDAVGAHRAVLIAHSNGAALAARLLAAAPDRIVGTVAIGPNDGRVEGSRAPAWLLATPHARRVGPALMRQLGGEPGLGLLKASYARPERLLAEVEAAFHASRGVRDWDVGLWQVITSSRPLPEGAWRALTDQPVLVVAGSEDAVVPLDATRALASDVLRSELVTIDGCGHAAHEECPESVSEAIRAATRAWTSTGGSTSTTPAGGAASTP